MTGRALPPFGFSVATVVPAAVGAFAFWASTVWQTSIVYSFAFNIAGLALYSFQYAAACTRLGQEMGTLLATFRLCVCCVCE